MKSNPQEWFFGLLPFLGIANSQLKAQTNAENWGDKEAPPTEPEPELPVPEQPEPEEPEDEPIVLTRNVNSRPQNWDSFVGQSNKSSVSRLKMAIAAADKDERVLPHILLYGEPGLGKTTIARIMANETNAKIIETVGCSLSKQQDIFSIFIDINLIQNNGQRAILFIDEIHDIAKSVPETIWFPILEEYTFFHNLRNTKLMYDGEKYIVEGTATTLAPFTIIGATTDPGLLSAPLRDRFPIQCYLNSYTTEDLKQILLNYACKQRIRIREQAALSIARRARGTPRTAINLMIACKDRATVANLPITERMVDRQMEADGIDKEGLTRLDIKVLCALAKFQKGLGISNLAGSAGVNKTTISEMVEPLLKQRGYMETTNRRFITDKGKKLLKAKGLL